MVNEIKKKRKEMHTHKNHCQKEKKTTMKDEMA